MSLIKHGTGEVIGPDLDEHKKEAKSTDWTEKDQEELEQENSDADA